MRRLDAAAWGWAAIFAGAGTYDVWLVRSGRRTLSGAFSERRWVALGAWLILTAHLVDLLPQRLDPFHRVARIIERPRTFACSRP